MIRRDYMRSAIGPTVDEAIRKADLALDARTPCGWAMTADEDTVIVFLDDPNPERAEAALQAVEVINDANERR